MLATLCSLSTCSLSLPFVLLPACRDCRNACLPLLLGARRASHVHRRRYATPSTSSSRFATSPSSTTLRETHPLCTTRSERLIRRYARFSIRGTPEPALWRRTRRRYTRMPPLCFCCVFPIHFPRKRASPSPVLCIRIALFLNMHMFVHSNASTSDCINRSAS